VNDKENQKINLFYVNHMNVKVETSNLKHYKFDPPIIINENEKKQIKLQYNLSNIQIRYIQREIDHFIFFN
jgi:hypothetical protein